MSAKNHVFTLGIEEEFQIVDPETRELRSHIQQILAGGKTILKERLKPEMHQSVVDLRSELAALAARDGLKIASAGTHQFSQWMDQLSTVHERYASIVKDMQQIARANLIFGLHVHVGIPDREEAIERIMREGTGADRQLRIWEQTKDMKVVVDQIVAETYEGLNVQVGHAG
jgi:carboxylate-amine ligase